MSDLEPGLCESEFSLVRFGGDQARYDATYAGADQLNQLLPEAVSAWAAEIELASNFAKLPGILASRRSRREHEVEVACLPGFEGTIDLVASNEPAGFLDSSAFNLNSGFQPIQSASEDKSTPGIEHDRNYGKLIIACQQYRDGGQVDHQASGEVIA